MSRDVTYGMARHRMQGALIVNGNEMRAIMNILCKYTMNPGSMQVQSFAKYRYFLQKINDRIILLLTTYICVPNSEIS